MEATAPVDAALWLLEHLHRIETVRPPVLRTLIVAARQQLPQRAPVSDQ